MVKINVKINVNKVKCKQTKKKENYDIYLYKNYIKFFQFI